MISPGKHARTKAGHRFLEHTSEVRLEVWAGSVPDLLAEAGRALGQLLLGDAGGRGAVVTRRLAVQASDREALLVDWLNELLYRSETECWVPVDFADVEVTGSSVSATASGPSVQEPSALVKAATHHGLRLSRDDHTVRAKVVLDV